MGEKQVIITIGREFGSAGHEIAEELAKRFDFRLYDYHLLREIADEKNVAHHTLEPYDEVPKKGFGSRTSPEVIRLLTVSLALCPTARTTSWQPISPLLV